MPVSKHRRKVAANPKQFIPPRPTIHVPTKPLWFQCECGFREFAIQGFPQGGGLRLFRVTCARRGCNKQYEIDIKGTVAGFVSGSLTHIIRPDGKVVENG